MGYSFGTTGGGKGSNQALACARLGAESHMIGCVGNDDFGRRLRSTLSDGRVNCDCVDVSEDTSTGVAVITVTDAGDNAIVVAPGANAALGAPSLERATETFKKADAVLFQLEIPIAAVEAGLALARKTGCRTVLTPAPAEKLSPGIWPMIDYLVLNETELEFYSSKSGLKDKEKDDVIAAANVLLRAGTKVVIVTHGAEGGLVITREKTFTYAPFKVVAVDSTGAGDSFCAAMIVGLCEGMPLEQAIRFASAAGALACTRFGAHPSLPWRHEVEALLERGDDLSGSEGKR